MIQLFRKVSTLSLFAFIFITVMGLSGCGQTGPLYLPDEKQAS
ncbi:LPS translocon maturation chaperone LptM [Eionea flava]